MHGKRSQGSRDFFEEGTVNGQRPEGCFGGATSVLYLDLSDSYIKICRLKKKKKKVTKLYLILVYFMQVKFPKKKKRTKAIKVSTSISLQSSPGFQGSGQDGGLWYCPQAKCYLVSWLRPKTAFCTRLGMEQIMARPGESQPSASAALCIFWPQWQTLRPAENSSKSWNRAHPQLGCLCLLQVMFFGNPQN